MTVSEGTLRKLIELQAQVVDSSSSVHRRLKALWKIGDLLSHSGVKHPHAVGAELQAKTHSAVTRAVIFRGAKTRQLYADLDQLAELSSLRSIQYYYDMIALLDLGRRDAKLSADQRSDLLDSASRLDNRQFADYLRALKLELAPSRLGTDRRTKDALAGMSEKVNHARVLDKLLTEAISEDAVRTEFCSAVPANERESLANMAIALAAPLNLRLFRPAAGPVKSEATNHAFAIVYNDFRALLRMADDRERSRFRRLLTSAEFESIATKVVSIASATSLAGYRRDQKLSLPIIER